MEERYAPPTAQADRMMRAVEEHVPHTAVVVAWMEADDRGGMRWRQLSGLPTLGAGEAFCRGCYMRLFVLGLLQAAVEQLEEGMGAGAARPIKALLTTAGRLVSRWAAKHCTGPVAVES